MTENNSLAYDGMTFVKGHDQVSNPWPELFPEFAQQIRKHVGEANYNGIITEFSITTTPVTKAAQEIALMASADSYFNLVLQTRCGIPQITLEGEKKD